jgi:hypothetical protein
MVPVVLWSKRVMILVIGMGGKCQGGGKVGSKGQKCARLPVEYYVIVSTGKKKHT